MFDFRRPRSVADHVDEINRLDPQFFTRLYLITKRQVLGECVPMLEAHVEAQILERHRLDVARVAQRN